MSAVAFWVNGEYVNGKGEVVEVKGKPKGGKPAAEPKGTEPPPADPKTEDQK